ncbi:hypothetical protein [Sandarakinorhabdus sp. AAP62]|uniref:hypothetical protein n=1 Tax=Sandarakinorhabdus sp. AAP62 TaxID=1248916 RepID=UPI00030D2534|nr:hypothetical protein [Sandarakinorhabdus sp. AAP62]
MRAQALLASVLLAAPVQAAKVATPPVFTLRVSENGNPYLPVAVKQATLNIRIGLSFDTALILNMAPATSAGLKPFPFFGKRTFKNAMIPGGEATFRFNLATITPQGLPPKKVPTVWVSRPVASDADGILTVGALKADRIDIVLRETPPGSQTYVLKKKGTGETAIKSRIGDEEVDISLELNSPTTVMNARAGEALVAAGLARRANAVSYWRPFPGVALPYQALTPKAGLTIAGLPMRQLGVRVSERQAKLIDAAAKGTSTASDDEDTITVSADRKRRGGRDPWVLIGRDVLDDCSRVSFDRAGERWVLTCNFG